jgi:predicted  nucleic acid-binding Zn-ribbon protein
MTASVSVEISPSELIDKITILEIKLDRIKDAEKLVNVKHEFETLTAARDDALEQTPELDRLSAELKKANESLWEIEDDIRDCERAKDFGSMFVKLARAVYVNNDKRSQLKREINELLGSSLIEEKSYAAY